MLQDWFKLAEQGTSGGKEVLAGMTTWVTMAYIVAVNPLMLENAQMDFGAVFVATCLAAAFGSIFMGVVANLPVALAPGMGLNAFFTYSIVIGMNLHWQTALVAVFWSRILFLILSLTGVRERIVYAMTARIKTGIAISIGLAAIRKSPAVITGITNAVLVGICLVILVVWTVGRGGAVVTGIAMPITVAV